MNHLKPCIALAMATLVLNACGDDSSTGPSNVETEKINFQINEAEQKAILTYNYNEKLCQTDENRKSFQMKSFNYTGYEAYRYDFASDTLLIYNCDYSEYSADDLRFTNCSSTGLAFIGGKLGNPYGNWKYTGCDISRGERKCNSEDYGVITLDISKGNVKVTTINNNIKSANLGESEYLEDLLFYFKYGTALPSLNDIFEPGNPEQTAQEYGFTISKKSANSATFKVGNSEISVNLKKIQYSPDMANLTISGNHKTCELNYAHYDYDDITSDICKVSNAEFFSYDSDYDENENRFFYVDEYKINNTSDFRDCLDEIQEAVSEPIEVIHYSKAASKNTDDKRAKSFIKKMKKFNR